MMQQHGVVFAVSPHHVTVCASIPAVFSLDPYHTTQASSQYLYETIDEVQREHAAQVALIASRVAKKLQSTAFEDIITTYRSTWRATAMSGNDDDDSLVQWLDPNRARGEAFDSSSPPFTWVGHSSALIPSLHRFIEPKTIPHDSSAEDKPAPGGDTGGKAVPG